MAFVGLLGCSQLVGADFDVHDREPETETIPSEGAGGASGSAGDEADVAAGPVVVVGPQSEGGTAGDGAAQGGHAGDETTDCLNGGTLVTLPSNEQACDCPSGTWGPGCEVVTESMVIGTQLCVLRSDRLLSCWGFDFGNPPPQGLAFKAVSAGADHTCAVDVDGTLHCWGNVAVIGDVPTGVFKHVSSSENQSCALDEDGNPVCWGYGAEPPDEQLLQIQPTTGGAGCGLRHDGSIICWGGSQLKPETLPGRFTSMAAGWYQLCGITDNHELRCTESEQMGPPPSGSFEKVVIGNHHGCGILTDGTARCWGNNDYGQWVPSQDRFKSLALDKFSTCGVRTDGSVTCWGQITQHYGPGAPAGVFTSVASYFGRTCAIKVDGSVQCWRFAPAPPTGAFKQVAPGEYHACGIRREDDSLACWGDDQEGEADPPSGEFRRVSSGHSFSCGLTTSGKAQCWGWNFDGQTEAPDDTFIDISVGQDHACAVRENGTLACWGKRGVGLIEAPEGSYQRVYAGMAHSCALRDDGVAVCWGKLDADVNQGQSDAPDDGRFVELALGLYHSCGRTPQGSVECWGENGLAESKSRAGPFTSIDAGVGTTCGLHPNGRLECWGVETWPMQ